MDCGARFVCRHTPSAAGTPVCDSNDLRTRTTKPALALRSFCHSPKLFAQLFGEEPVLRTERELTNCSSVASGVGESLALKSTCSTPLERKCRRISWWMSCRRHHNLTILFCCLAAISLERVWKPAKYFVSKPGGSARGHSLPPTVLIQVAHMR